MSRANLYVHMGLGFLLLASGTSPAWAQTGTPTKDAWLENIEGGIAIPQANAIISTVSDPKAVDMLFKEGNTIVSVLKGLKEKGFPIEYKEKQFVPAMTLLSIPESTQIDDVLQEILQPWAFRAYRTPSGKLIVAPDKKSKVQAALETEARQTKAQE
ncbi:MAG: hypothetical protein ACJ8OJ_11770 [Povalibacter sp.]